MDTPLISNLKISLRCIFYISALFLFSCSSQPDFHPTPERAYDYYSGGHEYGNHYCKVQTFTHTESGKKVTLIGMIHTADQKFYREVDSILDEHDIILEEGIHGLQSFGVHKYFSKYIFYTIKRFNYLQELSSQGHTLKERDNTVLADMSSDDFASQGSILTPVIQLISLPVMMVMTEPYYILEKSRKGTLSIFSDSATREMTASTRHLTLSNMDITDDSSDTFLPGIITTRNAILIEKLEEQIKKDKIQTIAIPWGASHLPTLEDDLLKSGYTKNEEFRWIQTIGVKDYLENPQEYTQSSDFMGIPYLIEVEVTPKVQSMGILFSLISNTESSEFGRFSLIYGELLEQIKIKNGSYFSILPRVFGKPILFDYLNQQEKSRFRFLWFFSVGELE